jgi:ABC-type lipoprotein release transport system permease subunit
MTYFNLIRKNLLYYWKRNLALAMGVAISTAVITGALMVGDSVKHNLNKGVNLRLGAVTHTVMAGDRFFTETLASGVEKELNIPVAPVLLLDGMAITEGGQKRINKIQVIGVNEKADQTFQANTNFKNLADDEVIISLNLANRLNIKIGDEILFRIRKASLIPLNTPFVSDVSNTVPIRLKVKAIAGNDKMGRFNLHISQTAPFNAFVSLKLLNTLMGLKERVNVLLITGKLSLTKEKIDAAIQNNWTLADMNLNFKSLPASNSVQINSDRVFIAPTVVDAINKITNDKRYIITYFVNSFTLGTNSTPYSFVSTLPDNQLKGNEIVINKWLAEDLKAKPGDNIDLKYFVVGPLKELTEKKASFRIKAIVDISGNYADKDLIPNLPGMTDAGNCRDWDTGVPIDLKKIRKKDEDYWNKWRGTPKAFIANSRGIELWNNRFGTYTSVRISDNLKRAATRAAPTSDLLLNETARTLQQSVDPASLGYVVDPARENGNAAAQNGVDFSQLFSGLSFFILVAGIVLIMLLFLLNMESRQEQLKTLTFLGISMKKVRMTILYEVLIVSFVGTIIGTGLAYVYCLFVFSALNSVWNDVVRTEMMDVVVNWKTLLSGMLIGIEVASLTVYFLATRYLRRLGGLTKKKTKVRNQNRWIKTNKIIAALSGIGSLTLIITQIIHLQSVNPTVFFSAGGLMLISLLVYTDLLFEYIKKRTLGKESIQQFNITNLCLKNAIRNKNRSLNIIILFAIGTFIVISTGANRQDLFVDAGQLSSGTGGFLTYAESTVPVVKDLNNKSVRQEFEMEGSYPIVQFMRHEGDDASCLNLNRVKNPAILGVKPEQLNGRFTFESSTPLLNKENTWSSLNQKLAGGVIPAFADETVIKWGLGLSVGDTLVYKNEKGDKMKLKLIGGLANSIFQGHVIIAQKYFLANFPSGSGSTLFLIDSKKADEQAVEDELKQSFRDYGWEIVPAAQKLAEFNSIENTYLSIFLVMGALGLLIGTVGLGVILVRSIIERRSEIALLKAVGFGRKLILKLFVNEYTGLLCAGILIGVITATVAILPSLISPNTGISFKTIALILVLLIVNGLFWITLLTRLFLNVDQINEALRNE